MLAVMHGPCNYREVLRCQVSFQIDLDVEILGGYLHDPDKQVTTAHLLFRVNLDEKCFTYLDLYFGIVPEDQVISDLGDKSIVPLLTHDQGPVVSVFAASLGIRAEFEPMELRSGSDVLCAVLK